jgi:RNA polymerase sigma-32 factor
LESPLITPKTSSRGTALEPEILPPTPPSPLEEDASPDRDELDFSDIIQADDAAALDLSVPIAELEDSAPSGNALVLKPRRAQSLSPIALTDRQPATLDPLRRYMSEIMRHPLLSREEEHELAVRLRETGDVDAAYRLVTANLRLVVKLAHEYRRNTLSLLDLIQEGNVGLMHAVQKFDPYRGVKLSSYAAFWIRAYILRYILENFRIVKLGTTQAQRKLFFNLRKERDKLVEQGFEPTAKLLAQRLDVTEEDVTEMEQRMSAGEQSLDAPVSDDDPTPRADRFVWEAPAVDETLGNLEIQEIMRRKLDEFGASLEGREKQIFEKRLVAEEPLTLQALGEEFGLTRERTRQIEAKLVKNLKTWIQSQVADFKYLEIDAGD